MINHEFSWTVHDISWWISWNFMINHDISYTISRSIMIDHEISWAISWNFTKPFVKFHSHFMTYREQFVNLNKFDFYFSWNLSWTVREKFMQNLDQNLVPKKWKDILSNFSWNFTNNSWTVHEQFVKFHEQFVKIHIFFIKNC